MEGGDIPDVIISQGKEVGREGGGGGKKVQQELCPSLTVQTRWPRLVGHHRLSLHDRMVVVRWVARSALFQFELLLWAVGVGTSPSLPSRQNGGSSLGS